MILIGDKIKDLRQRHRMTQTQFAEKLGVTKSTVAAYENGTRLPSYEVLIKMANAYGVSTDFILLDRADSGLDTEGLSEEEMAILRNLIMYFRKEK